MAEVAVWTILILYLHLEMYVLNPITYVLCTFISYLPLLLINCYTRTWETEIVTKWMITKTLAAYMWELWNPNI